MDRTAALYQQAREVTFRLRQLMQQVRQQAEERRTLLGLLRAEGESVDEIARNLSITRARAYAILGVKNPRAKGEQ